MCQEGFTQRRKTPHVNCNDRTVRALLGWSIELTPILGNERREPRHSNIHPGSCHCAPRDAEMHPDDTNGQPDVVIHNFK